MERLTQRKLRDIALSVSLRRAILWLTTIAVAATAFFYLSQKADWTSLLDLSPAQILLVCLSTVALLSLYAMGAAALLSGLGYSAGATRVLLAMLASSTISLGGDPKLGVPSRLLFYKLFADIPFSVGTAQTTVESLMWLAMMGILIIIPGPLTDGYALPLLLTAAGLVTLGIVTVVAGPNLLDRLWIIGPIFRRMDRIRRFTFDVRSSILAIRPTSLLLASVWFGATYVVDILTVWFLAGFLGASLPLAGIGHALVISYLVGAASLLPLGLGIRDVTFVLLLQQAGLTSEQASAIALVHRTARTVLPLVLGLLVMPFVLSFKHKANQRPGAC